MTSSISIFWAQEICCVMYVWRNRTWHALQLYVHALDMRQQVKQNSCYCLTSCLVWSLFLACIDIAATRHDRSIVRHRFLH